MASKGELVLLGLAVLAITLLEAIALIKETDGVYFSAAVGAIAGIITWVARGIYEKGKGSSGGGGGPADA